MNTPLKIGLAAALAVSLGAVMYFGAQRIIEQQRTTTEITRLRDALYRARVTANRCQQTIQGTRLSLDDFRARLDDMRARVDSFEAIDPAGVAEERYDDYMQAFTAFNDSVSLWETRESQLRTADASCRNVIVRHNALQDSLQSVLAEAGIEAS